MLGRTAFCVNLLLMALVPCEAALADQPGSADKAKQALERARQDPEQYARLLAGWEAFRRLPSDEQQRLEQLDRDLHGLDAANYSRLHRTLERYVSWLESLPEQDRQSIVTAEGPDERLKRIKAIRRNQWISRLPKAYRDALGAAAPDERQTLVMKYQQEDLERRRQWQDAIHHWDDLLKAQAAKRVQEQQPQLQAFIKEHLRPRLSADEVKRLDQAEGKGTLYQQTLVELADKHALPFPGPAKGPSRFKELPADVQECLLLELKSAQRARLAGFEGKWPEYAVHVAEMARRNKIALPSQLGPCRPGDFNASIQQFLAKDLEAVLNADEKARLQRSQGNWPLYPRTIMELARKHRLTVPGVSLPGPKDYWDKFRASGQK
jgi:hypothetical protein